MRRPTASASATPTQVTLTSKTVITKTVKTTSASLKVGLCASAQGKTDSTGAVTATSIRLTSASKGSCTTER